MAENNGTPPEHVDASTSKAAPSDNPDRDVFNVSVNVPEVVDIKLVHASALSEYEVWLFVASVLSNALVGFLVAYYQADVSARPLTGWISFVWAVLFVIAVVRTGFLRYALGKKGRSVRLKTFAAEVQPRK